MKNVLKKNAKNKNLMSSLKQDGLTLKKNFQEHTRMKMNITLGSKFFQRTSEELNNSTPNQKISINKVSTNLQI